MNAAAPGLSGLLRGGVTCCGGLVLALTIAVRESPPDAACGAMSCPSAMGLFFDSFLLLFLLRLQASGWEERRV